MIRITTIAARTFTAVALVMMTSASQAAPTFDPSLEKYLGNDKLGSETVRVVALFKDKVPMRRMSTSPMNRLQVEHDMIQNSMESQKAVVASFNQLRAAGQIKAQRLWLINGLLLEIPARELEKLKNSNDVKSVTADFPVGLIKPVAGTIASRDREDFTYGLQKLQIPELRAAIPGATGKGIRVGIVDTGIDGTHPDLKGRVVAFKDFVNGQTVAYDDNKHGTHVAGTIGGRNASGTNIGVAPEVSYIGAKFLDKNGSGTFANAVAAMQWIADPDGNPATDDAPSIVSNSWGGGKPSSSEDPADNAMCKAAQGWVQLGILPVFAAGNSGPSARTVGLPGGCPLVLTVGATDQKDAAASFSSRGPAVWKTGSFTKPDLAAPGVAVKSSIPGGGYAEFSGTSMATPHVSGLAALLYQVNPKLEVTKAVQILKSTSDNVGADPNTFGAGRINALKAVKAMSGSRSLE
ncbi:MAG: S8 family serine peptidase [Bdellovibrionales bacterium]|nr:S8 family serine peptidase [Bdellovibrionales bacterium]